MRRDYNDPAYRDWRIKIYERDKYRCDCCGKRGWINAHHLNGWNWCYAGRFDVDNGVTLCAGRNGCHNKFHKMFGRGNNTKSQYLQFKRMKK